MAKLLTICEADATMDGSVPAKGLKDAALPFYPVQTLNHAL